MSDANLLKYIQQMRSSLDGLATSEQGLGDMLKSIYDTNNDGIVDKVPWGGIQSIPASFPGGCTGNAATATNVAWTGITGRPGYEFVPFQSPTIVVNGGTLTASFAATYTPANMGATGKVPTAYAIRVSNKWASIATTAWLATAATATDTQGAVNLYPYSTVVNSENSGICPADSSGQIRMTGGSTAGVAAMLYLLCYGYFI